MTITILSTSKQYLAGKLTSVYSLRRRLVVVVLRQVGRRIVGDRLHPRLGGERGLGDLDGLLVNVLGRRDGLGRLGKIGRIGLLGQGQGGAGQEEEGGEGLEAVHLGFGLMPGKTGFRYSLGDVSFLTLLPRNLQFRNKEEQAK